MADTLSPSELKSVQDAVTKAKLTLDAAHEAVTGGGGAASASAIARLQRLAEGNSGCGCGNCGCSCGGEAARAVEAKR
jgi:hypothetical protein